MTKVSPPNPLLPVTPSQNLVAPLPGPLTTPDVSNRQGLLPNIPRQGLPITQTAATKVLETSANAFPVPKTLDDVANGQTYAKVLAEYISNGVVHNFKGIWNSTTAYNIGDEVLYSNAYWVSLANNSNSTPNRNNSNWQAVGTYNGYTGAWSSTTTYNPGDEVTYNGNYWVCVTQNTNSAPSTSNSNWVIAGPLSLDYVANGTTYAKSLSSTLVNGYPGYRTSAAAILALSPTHYWPLDNAELSDLGSSPSTLTVVGSAVATPLSVAPGDATGGTFISNSQSSALYGSATDATTWTISCWVNPGFNQWANASGIIGRAAGAPFGTPTAWIPHLFADTGGYFYAAVDTSPAKVIKSAISYSPSIPHHVVATFGSGTLSLYVDGSLQAQATGLGSESTSSVNIWTLGTVYGTSWPAPLSSGWNTNAKGINMQDVAIWEGTALSNLQVQSIYNAGAGQIHDLSSIGDSPSRFAVTNMAGGNAVASVDSNNLAIIDFSQIHVHKTIDYVPNGTTRFAVGYIDSNNRALIDFSQGGHVNKTLDYINNGSTYARPLGSTLVNGYPAYRTSAAAILAQNPTHYWPLDNNSYNDLGSSPSNLTLVGSSAATSLSVAPGDATGGTFLSNSQASAFYASATAATTWTISCWVNPGFNQWANTSGIVGRTNAAPFGTPTAYEAHLFADVNGYFYAAMYNGSVQVIKSSISFSPSVPHHVVATLGSGVLSLYVDGTLQAQASGLAAESSGSENLWVLGTVYGTSWPSPLGSGWNTNSKGVNLQDVAVWEGTALSSLQVASIYNAGAGQIHDLSSINDSPTFKRVTGVSSSNQATTSSITANAVTSSVTQTTTSYVNITTSGQIASATITPNGGYVTLEVCGAIASTNTSASGWGLTFYKAGTAMSPAFSYQSFATPGDDKYKPFCFKITDTSPGTSSVTYTVSVSTNSGGTVSLIPVNFVVENMKV